MPQCAELALRHDCFERNPNRCSFHPGLSKWQANERFDFQIHEHLVALDKRGRRASTLSL